MQKYEPPFSITHKMIKYIAMISEKLGKMSITQDINSKPHLRKNNRIKSIHSSLKIEANSLSLNQVKDVVDGHLVLGERKEIQEVKNAYMAYEQISKIDPYSLDDLKSLHATIGQYVIEETGKFRRGEEGVFNDDVCIFMAPPAKLVSTLMSNLFEWMEREKDNIHPLILSSIFHYEFVFIHPFTDGNGRMARLWHTCILTKWKPIFEYIPIESQIEKFQEEYYDVIAKCHQEGSSNLFIEFMLVQIDKVLNEMIKQLNINVEQMSEYVKKLINIMEYDIPYTTRFLMDQLGLKSRETFRKNYMNPAMKLHIVEMTIPDKPNSKNQRYIKKSL